MRPGIIGFSSLDRGAQILLTGDSPSSQSLILPQFALVLSGPVGWVVWLNDINNTFTKQGTIGGTPFVGDMTKVGFGGYVLASSDDDASWWWTGNPGPPAHSVIVFGNGLGTNPPDPTQFYTQEFKADTTAPLILADSGIALSGPGTYTPDGTPFTFVGTTVDGLGMAGYAKFS